MRVLDYEQRGTAAALQLAEHRFEQRRSVAIVSQQRTEPDFRCARDVMQRRQRVRCLQCVAGTPPQVRFAAPRRQCGEQAGLADAGLAADQNCVAGAAGDGTQGGFELLQGVIAFN